MTEDGIDWGTGLSADRQIGGVSRRRPLPMSESLRAFRQTLPDVEGMKPGEEFFLPTLDVREDYVVSALLRKLNGTHFDRRWYGLQEWRSHLRGRLVVCISPEAEPLWRELRQQMIRAIQTNKKTPPLDARGNALVPPLRRV